jgi:cephalosporin hydroxylase
LGIIAEGLRFLRKEGPIAFLKRANTYFVTRYVRISLAIREVQAAKRNLKTIEADVDFAFSFSYLGVSIRPNQVKEEIIRFLVFTGQLKPKVTLEIGTANGGTLFLLCQVSQPEALILSVDLPYGKFGGGGARARIPLLKAFAKNKQDVHLIKANSHDFGTLRLVKKILGPRMVDLLFIDGDHTYDGVRQDYEMYAPLVRKGGMVAFHDIVEHTQDMEVKVNKFWNEIKSSGEHVEIVNEWSQKWGGIGILYI